MPYLLFFAGIGGFDIAFERNGFATNFLCEINPFCQSILSQHWPDVKKGNDINEIKVLIYRILMYGVEDSHVKIYR